MREPELARTLRVAVMLDTPQARAPFNRDATPSASTSHLLSLSYRSGLGATVAAAF